MSGIQPFEALPWPDFNSANDDWGLDDWGLDANFWESLDVREVQVLDTAVCETGGGHGGGSGSGSCDVVVRGMKRREPESGPAVGSATSVDDGGVAELPAPTAAASGTVPVERNVKKKKKKAPVLSVWNAWLSFA